MIPVEKNKEYNINITAVADDGNGIGRIDGFTVFVPGTVDGDTVKVLIVKVKKSYAYGKLIKILQSSDKRVLPTCPVAAKCGGCSFMHIEYSHQLNLKRDFICQNIRKIGGISDFEFDEMLGMDFPYKYRNKMIFPVGYNKDQKLCYGFYAKKSHRIVPLSACELGSAECSAISDTVISFMKINHISAYDEVAHKGLVRRVFIRTSKLTAEIMVIIVICGDSIPSEAELVQTITSNHPNVSSIIINSNKDKTNLVLGEKNRTVFGNDYITDEILGSKFKISPHSFFQVNPYQTEKLYNKCLEYANITKNDIVMDVYCGTGTISLAAAKSAKKVIGIEIVDAAISDAKRSALENCVSNAEFYCGSADKLVPYMINSGDKPDIVILDPPRKGSDEVTLGAIVKAEPKRISYVSCNPSTLARDIEYLTKNGYNLEKVSGVDMFPHTTGVESVALLVK